MGETLPQQNSAPQALATPVGNPLRAESGEALDSSGKMVNLADLHVNTGTPVTPRESIPHGVDPLDPLLQLLVQDRLFIAAVQTRQLHAAAGAAVKLLRAQFSPTNNRAADRRHANGDALDHGVRGSGGHQRYYGSIALGPGMQVVKQQVLQLEECIPWTMVRRNWRNRRPSWRRQVRNCDIVSDFAARLKELRGALLTEDSAFIGCGPTWRNQLEACVHGKGTSALLAAVWEEMRNTVRSWLEGRVTSSPATSLQMHANTMRAVQAMASALRQGGAEQLFQAPIESIVGHDSQGLHAVRQVLELERSLQNGNLAQNMGLGNEQMGAYFTSDRAPWEYNFDSGAESDPQDGGDATDLDPDFDD